MNYVVDNCIGLFTFVLIPIIFQQNMLLDLAVSCFSVSIKSLNVTNTLPS